MTFDPILDTFGFIVAGFVYAFLAYCMTQLVLWSIRCFFERLP